MLNIGQALHYMHALCSFVQCSPRWIRMKHHHLFSLIPWLPHARMSNIHLSEFCQYWKWYSSDLKKITILLHCCGLLVAQNYYETSDHVHVYPSLLEYFLIVKLILLWNKAFLNLSRPTVAEQSKASVFVLDHGRGRSWVRTPATTDIGRSFSFVVSIN